MLPVNFLQWRSHWVSGAIIGDGMLNLLRVSRSGFPDLIMIFYVPNKALLPTSGAGLLVK
jgi:hypothetical protein